MRKRVFAAILSLMMCLSMMSAVSFAADAYAVSVNVNGFGIALADKTTASTGETVTLIATPDNGYRLWKWESSDVEINGNSFVMPDHAVTVTAYFEVKPAELYKVTVSTEGNGRAGSDFTYAEMGETVTVSARPDSGSHFKEWKSDDVTINDDGTFTMPEKSITVTAVFEEHSYDKEVVDEKYLKSAANCTEPDTYYKSCECGEAGTEDTFTVGEALGHHFTGYICDVCGFDNTPVPVSYKIISGANGTWTKGSSSGLTVVSDAPFDKFESVKVDGNVISGSCYTAAEGSTKITLNSAYLNTLSVGSHSIEIVSNDGSASTNFTVKQAKSSVPTGDNTNILFWMMLMFAAAAAVAGTCVYSKKR